MYEGSSFAWPMVYEISHDSFVPKKQYFYSLQVYLYQKNLFFHQLTQNKKNETMIRLQYGMSNCFVLKVMKSQNKYMKSLHCPKYEQNIREISALEDYID